MTRILALLFTSSLALAAADLTGNWAAKDPRPDGTIRRSYFDLQQQGDKIRGHIRADPFYFTVSDSSGTPENFTLTATRPDGKSTPTAKFEGRLEGDELHITMHRRPGAPPIEMVAHRAPAGEGAMPARVPLPALHKVPYNGLAKTPPMGWNSWNKFASRVDDAGVRAAADALESTGMKDAGYEFVNIDDTWQGERDAQGVLQPNKKFPDMKALADYVHGKGLKIGIYSSPGPNTCAGYKGSLGHEEQDAKTYAEWGIDYLKYDWCGARNIYKDTEMQPLYQKMGDALQSTGRKIVYSLCQYGREDVWEWGPEVGGNLWRTTGDIRDRWDSMKKIGFDQGRLAPFAAPGHWNDPDMLEVGNGGMTPTEYRTHMSLWAMLAAPLLAGNDLANMDSETQSILTNRGVIAIDQDAAGKQGKRKAESGDTQIWVKDLSGGDQAVAVFNLGESETTVPVKWSQIGLKTPSKAQDVWSGKDIDLDGPEYKATVASHGVLLLRVPGSDR